jgi:hypothetical protein
MELSIGEIRILIEALAASALEYGSSEREAALLVRLREVRERREEEIRRG